MTAFWRNDAQDGLSVFLRFNADTGDRFAAAVGRAVWLHDTSVTAEQCFAWLAGAAHRKERMSGHELDRAVATIYWLEQRGHLPCDEFNGVVWLARRAGQWVVLGRDAAAAAPSPPPRDLDASNFDRELQAIFSGGSSK